MNQATNSNGNGENGQQLRQLKKIAESETASSPSDVKESLVTFQTAEGLEMDGVPTRVTRHTVVFELCNPSVAPRLSEVLSEFKIILQDRTIYSGRAVVRNTVNAGLNTVCEATLNESHWTNVDLGSVSQRNGQLVKEFNTFVEEWQKLYKVLPEYKVVLADMQTFLADLRLWLEQIEAGIRASPSADRIELEREIAGQLEPKIVPAIVSLFERFEEVSNHVDEDLIPAHRAFGKRQLHPLLLCSPFVYRTFHKPLGYAGDYEMVNMMFRDPFEGGSLFAKMINVYALQLPPIIAHRNRIAYLCERLAKESLRVMVRGGTTRVFNLGCGPAHEVQRFLTEDEVSDYVHFTLADFSQETLQHTSTVLSKLKQRYERRTTIQMMKKTVHQLIKSAARTVQYPKSELYDIIYCAGLFDYLSDRTCLQLMEIFYEMLAPGGLLIATNVDEHPARNEMECFLEWHLVQRDNNRIRAIAPGKAVPENISLKRDPTGVNVFMEVRKPDGET
jgi:extracellular factor (EF) 3-hydroxypalmitic acid methyl ester biosynthesis protein